jgi:hypothetical protein
MPVGWACGRCDGTAGIEGRFSHAHRFIHHRAAGKSAAEVFHSYPQNAAFDDTLPPLP